MCRRLHFVGTSLVLATLLAAALSGRALWLIAVPFVGYGFAWVGHFFFEHNRPCEGINIQVQVYTVSGKLVKTLEGFSLCNGTRETGITWDGRDDLGDPLAKGVYVYRLRVRSPDGDSAEKLEKLVLLR